MPENQGTGSPLRVIIVIAVIAIGVIVYFALQPEVRDGQAIFKKEGCVKCHTFRGVGSGIIDLNTVTERHTDNWIRDQIIDARRHDPGSGMPRFGHLPDEEIDNLIRFLHEGPAK